MQHEALSKSKPCNHVPFNIDPNYAASASHCMEIGVETETANPEPLPPMFGGIGDSGDGTIGSDDAAVPIVAVAAATKPQQAGACVDHITAPRGPIDSGSGRVSRSNARGLLKPGMGGRRGAYDGSMRRIGLGHPCAHMRTLTCISLRSHIQLSAGARGGPIFFETANQSRPRSPDRMSNPTTAGAAAGENGSSGLRASVASTATASSSSSSFLSRLSVASSSSHGGDGGGVDEEMMGRAVGRFFALLQVRFFDVRV